MADRNYTGDVEEMLAEASSDSIVPGICVTCADYIDDSVEPDCEDGYCEDCDSHTVKSILILAGVI